MLNPSKRFIISLVFVSLELEVLLKLEFEIEFGKARICQVNDRLFEKFVNEILCLMAVAIIKY